MSSLETRVADCFCAVFPERSRDELLTASRESIPEWDSLSSITLLMLLQQEFSLDLDLTELELFNSFSDVLDFVSARVPAHGDRHND
jgi:acyl carrier protein